MAIAVTQFKCPNCGGEVQVTSRFDEFVTCKYCGTSFSTRNQAPTTDENATGNQFLLLSQLQLSQQIEINGNIYTVKARLRLTETEESWDEWYLKDDQGESAWIEDSGEQMAFATPLKANQAPNYDDIRVGDTIKIDDHSGIVSELGTIAVTGSEGDTTGLELKLAGYKYAQANISQDQAIIIEYYRAGKAVYLVDYIEHQEIHVKK